MSDKGAEIKGLAEGKDRQSGGSTARKRRSKLAAAVFALLFLFSAFDVRLKTVRYTVQSEKIGAPVRIALVTDLHSCSYGKGQRTLVAAIEKQNPDILLLGGDIFDDGLPDRNTEIFLAAIADNYPCYYVTGNHEYWSYRVDEMLYTLRKYRVEILDGKTKTIEIKGQKLSLSGIDDPDAAYYSDAREVLYTQLNEIRNERDKNLYSVLLAHRPSYIELYRKYKFDLVLSGHAHGGQWRIPYLLNGVFAPDEGWFPKYAGGQYRFADGQMIVSRGLARESTRVPRIFNRPELVIVDLQPASPEGSAQ